MTKKAEGLIEELCTTMPLATRKGNTGLKELTAEKADSHREDQNLGMEKPARPKEANGKKENKPVGEEYDQISIFELL